MVANLLPPEQTLARLMEGNSRFMAHRAHPAATADEIYKLGNEGQHPWAVVVACSDSRVPPELVFDCGLGELFVVRTAGHVLTEVELGSVAYAVVRLGVRLVVVLGHSGCGAIAASLSGQREAGTLGSLLEQLRPAVEESAGTLPACQRAARAEWCHIRGCATLLREHPDLAEAAPLVAAAKYDTLTGRVTLLPDGADSAAGAVAHNACVGM